MSDDRDDPTLSAPTAEALSLLTSALPVREPAPERRQVLLAELRGRERFAPFLSEISAAFGLSPLALRTAFARIRDESAWVPGFWPGSRLLSTPELGRAYTVLARLSAGSRIESHGHPYRELTYVLDGELHEDDQRRLGPGQLLVMEPGTTHAISVADHSECLVVFAIDPS